MFALFPELLFLAPFAALMLRIALGMFLVIAGYKHYTRSSVFTVRTLGLIEIIVAGLLIVGASTQLSATIALLLVGLWIFVPRVRPLPWSTAVLLGAISLSLILTGPGAIAIDIPL